MVTAWCCEEGGERDIWIVAKRLVGEDGVANEDCKS